MSRNQAPQLMAGGDINPSRFVKQSTAADNTALQAGANDVVIGISQVGTKEPPGLSGASTLAAASGEMLEIFGIGDVALLTAGSGGFTHGDLLESDANGKGVTVGSGSRNVGAIALESAAAGEAGRVCILPTGTRGADTSAVASADGAITAKTGTVFVTKAGVAVLTIADPTATTDDGKTLTIISVTANAHTVSNAAGSGFNGGGAGTDVGTFGGAKGDNMTFVAYQGVWYVRTLRNVTLG